MPSKLTRSLQACGAAALLVALAAPAGAQAPDKDTLVIAQGVDIETLEPDNLNATQSINIASHLWATLLQVTPDGTVVPSLAESFSWNAAGTELTFKIRKGQACENGEPLTAEDVVYSLKRQVDPALGLKGNIGSFVYPTIGFVDARQDGEDLATVILKKYQSIAPGMLAQAYIKCKGAYEPMTKEQAAKTVIASGPYKLVSWTLNDRLVMERNPAYTLAEPKFKRIVWRVIPEASTRSAELIAGNVDIATNIPPDQQGAVNSRGTATVMPVSGTRRIFVGFNFADAFKTGKGGEAIQKPEVRQALNMAVDVPAICTQLLSFTCTRATGPANLGNPTLKPYPYDPKAAEAMLDKAGYPRGADGTRFTLKLQGPRNRYRNDTNVAQVVGQYLSDIGVQTTVELQDFVTIFSPAAREHRAGPLFLIGQGGVTWSAVYDMALFPTREAPVNNGMWFNPQWQSRWDSLAGIRDAAEERKVVDEMLKIFYDDPPWIMLYFQPDFYGVSKRVAWTPRRDEKIDALAVSLKP